MPVQRITRILLGVIALAVFGLFPFAEAFATAVPTAQEQTKVLAGQMGNVPKFIAVVCYVIGVFYTARALLALKRYLSNADENPINTFISYGAIGSMLIVLPFVIVVMVQTFNMAFPTVESSQQAFEGAQNFKSDYHQGASSSTMEALFVNLGVSFVPLAKTMAVIAYVMAAVIVLVGLLHLKNYGDDPSQVPVRSIVIKFVLAAMLVSLPFAMQLFVTTVTGRDTIEDQEQVFRPCLIAGSGLAALRKSSTSACK